MESTLEHETFDTLFTLATTIATVELYIVETWDLVQSIVGTPMSLRYIV